MKDSWPCPVLWVKYVINDAACKLEKVGKVPIPNNRLDERFLNRLRNEIIREYPWASLIYMRVMKKKTIHQTPK